MRWSKCSQYYHMHRHGTIEAGNTLCNPVIISFIGMNAAAFSEEGFQDSLEPEIKKKLEI